MVRTVTLLVEVITLMMECVNFGLLGFLELAVVICYVFLQASFAKITVLRLRNIFLAFSSCLTKHFVG